MVKKGFYRGGAAGANGASQHRSEEPWGHRALGSMWGHPKVKAYVGHQQGAVGRHKEAVGHREGVVGFHLSAPFWPH